MMFIYNSVYQKFL